MLDGNDAGWDHLGEFFDAMDGRGQRPRVRQLELFNDLHDASDEDPPGELPDANDS